MNSSDKGKRGEREFSAWLRERGVAARRGRQFQGGPDSPDIVAAIPGWHFEVKRVEKLNIHEAHAKAANDAGSLKPIVAYRRNRGEWMVTLKADDWLWLWRERWEFGDE